MARPRNKTTGFLAIYEACLRIKINTELQLRPDLCERLGTVKKAFIRWCAKQRVEYMPDLNEEVMEFLEGRDDKRLSASDPGEWKRISLEIFARDGFICHYCGERGGNLEVDHMIPVSRGGTDESGNLTTACRRCNRQKKDRTPEEFKAWRDSR